MEQFCVRKTWKSLRFYICLDIMYIYSFRNKKWTYHKNGSIHASLNWREANVSISLISFSLSHNYLFHFFIHFLIAECYMFPPWSNFAFLYTKRKYRDISSKMTLYACMELFNNMSLNMQHTITGVSFH